MDELFSKSQFDERDLVKTDKEVQAKFEEILKRKKDDDKVSKEKYSDKPQPEQATLKKLD